ncbi:MAG: DnaD domain protein [Dehalococcoidales bacterium]|nr:DnaD domain protein [Dehalococcoidales bacterium]
MSEFKGFPARMEFTPVPNVFLSNLLPEITDIAELKVTLHLFRLLYFKKGYPKFVTFNELAGDISLINSIKETGKQTEATLHHALELATQRKTILHITVEDGSSEDIYLLNTETNIEVITKIQNGEIHLSGLETKHVSPEVITEKQPNIFTLYEENIGLLTPMIAEQLKVAENDYPEQWIKDAIKEAVNAGKRNWRYISAILERWATEGKSDGTHLRDFKKTDPDKFIKGKYGHAVKR